MSAVLETVVKLCCQTVNAKSAFLIQGGGKVIITYSTKTTDEEKLKAMYDRVFKALRRLEVGSDSETAVVICKKAVTIEIPVELVVEEEELFIQSVIMRLIPSFNGVNLVSADAEVMVQVHQRGPEYVMDRKISTFGPKSFKTICKMALGKCAKLQIVDTN